MASAGAPRRAVNDPSMRGDALQPPWHSRAFASGTTTSAGSTPVRSPHPERTCSRGWESPGYTKPSLSPSSDAAWHQRLLEDAQAACEGDLEEDEEAKRADELANEMALACNALGRELSRLAGFVQWADGVVGTHEAGVVAMDSVAADKCRSPAMDDVLSPECFYIGDGSFAQLIADAEAAKRASP